MSFSPTLVSLQAKARSRRALAPRLAAALILFLTCSARGQSQLTVDLSSNTGPVMHGAIGWLYGQVESGIPSRDLMAPLKPRVAAQKPPHGIQHAGGDALQVIGNFGKSGGQQMEIYLQDIYLTFYPPYPGVKSYAATIRPLIRELAAAHTGGVRIVYDPLNEPDGQWYGHYKTGMTNLPQFESDWKTIFHTIRSVDPGAVIVGPSFSHYDAKRYRKFLAYAKANNVLPNQLSWHELQGDFYADWYSHYDSVRGIEKDLGIGPLPIVINEYGLSSGTLGVPGNLIQWISRFEVSKVDGCLAFWTPAGSLDGLAAAGTNDQATGAWWLYQWYAGMTGDTIKVTPPNANARGLAGVAAIDLNTRQARVILGGASGKINVVLKGLNSVSDLGNPVHITLWGVDSAGAYPNGKGFRPSSGPYYISENNYTTSNGKLTVTVPHANPTSAYLLIVTPAKSLSSVGNANQHQAEYASLSGSAIVTYGNATGYSGTGFVQGYGNGGNAATEFDVTAPTSGFYAIDLRYSSPHGDKALQLNLNGSALKTIDLAGTKNGNTWLDKTVTVFLTQGINRIAYASLENSRSDGVELDSMRVTPVGDSFATYDAAASGNTLSGTTVREKSSSAPSGTDVRKIGQGSDNYLQFNNIHASSTGLYRMLVTYANDEKYSGTPGGPVFRFAQISINGGAARKVYFNNTFSWDAWSTREVDVRLHKGKNTIRFFNSTKSPGLTIDSGWAPIIAAIQIAPAMH